MSTHNIHLKYRTPKRYPTIISIMPPDVALIVTFRGSNKLSWSQWGSSHRSSTVFDYFYDAVYNSSKSCGRSLADGLTYRSKSRVSLNKKTLLLFMNIIHLKPHGISKNKCRCTVLCSLKLDKRVLKFEQVFYYLLMGIRLMVEWQTVRT